MLIANCQLLVSHRGCEKAKPIFKSKGRPPARSEPANNAKKQRSTFVARPAQMADVPAFVFAA
jgi:hypothetical protein